MATLSTAEACARLGIRPQTLYAYVSRGLLTPAKDGRRSRFPASQVEALAQRTARGRRPGRFEIHIETAVTLLEPRGRLLYRGADAVELASSWSYERAARWLTTGRDDGREPPPWIPDAEASAAARAAQAAVGDDAGLGHRLRVALTAIAARRAGAPTDHPTLVATLVDSLPVVTRCRPDSSIATRLWCRLSPLRPTAARVAALDAALVLLADHELAASTLAARVAASTWAPPLECVLAGLSAHAGPLHGGADEAVRALLRDTVRRGADAALDDLTARSRPIPGVGHAVYRDVDPRAGALLGAVRGWAPPTLADAVDDLVSAVGARTTAPVNVDVSVAALAEAGRMVTGAGVVVFAIARTAGWLAHADEESAYRLRFRPRAIYTGPRLD